MPNRDKTINMLTVDELLEKLDYCGYDSYYDSLRKPVIAEIRRRLKGQKAVEARIVRCKDCRFYTKPDSHGDRCDKIHWSRGDNWFCGDGKRR